MPSTLSMLMTDTKRTLLGVDVIATSSSSDPFLSALKTRLGLILAKAASMRVMINATGCPSPVSDHASMKTHENICGVDE